MHSFAPVPVRSNRVRIKVRKTQVTARQAAMQAHAIEQGALSAARQLASAARQITDAMHAQGVKLPLTTLGAHGSDAVRFIDKNTAAKIAAKAHKMDADADAAIPSAGRSESMYTGPAYPYSPRIELNNTGLPAVRPAAVAFDLCSVLSGPTRHPPTRQHLRLGAFL